MITKLKSLLKLQLSPYEIAQMAHHFSDRCAFCDTRMRIADAMADRLTAGKNHHVLTCRPCRESALRPWRARVRANSRNKQIAHARTRRILAWVKLSKA